MGKLNKEDKLALIISQLNILNEKVDFAINWIKNFDRGVEQCCELLDKNNKKFEDEIEDIENLYK